MKHTPPSLRDRVRAQLADLKLPGALEALDDVLAALDGGQLQGPAAIERLLGAQIGLRNNRRLVAAMRSSRLPAVKTLADFDFTFQPSLKRENVILLGPPGVGKSHLAISLAIAAAQSGRRVYYGTLADLITSLEEASLAGQLSHRLKTLVFPSLLVVDEFGYLPISRTGAMLFFQLMSQRYERASTVLTSNKGFKEWGEIFGDEVMASALIDRLVHHCHIVNIRGNSYRMKNHAALAAALRHETDPPRPLTCATTLRAPGGRRALGSPPTTVYNFDHRNCAISIAVDKYRGSVEQDENACERLRRTRRLARSSHQVAQRIASASADRNGPSRARIRI